MATLKELFTLTNSTYGESNEIALKLLLASIEDLDWSSMDGNFLTPLGAVYETLPASPALDGYRKLIMKTSDYLRFLQSEAEKVPHLQSEAEKVPHLQTAFERLRQAYQRLQQTYEKIKTEFNSPKNIPVGVNSNGKIVYTPVGCPISDCPDCRHSSTIISCTNNVVHH